MSGAEAARKYAHARTGHQLVSYREVALPLFRVECELLVMDSKPLPPVHEFVLRAVASGLDELPSLAGFLGIDRPLATTAAADLLGAGDLVLSGGADGPEHRLALTAKGRQTAQHAAQVQPVEVAIPVFVDGLTREVVSVNARAIGAFPARRAVERGLVEIAAFPKRRPHNQDIPFETIREAIASEARDRRGRRDVIGLVGLRGAKRYARQGVALGYRSAETGELLVSLVVDGRLSEKHDAQFGRAMETSARGMAVKTWSPADEDIAAELPAELLASATPPEETEKLLAEREGLMRERQRLQQDADTAAPAELGALRKRLDDATDQAQRLQHLLDTISVRQVEVYEHPGYLDRALADAQQRVMIISPWIRSDVVDAVFRQRLRDVLTRGVQLWIGYGISPEGGYRRGPKGDADRNAERALKLLAEDFDNFHLTRLGNTHAKVLVCDSRFSILTSFNWLSFRGDTELEFRDERGFYVGLADKVDELFDSYRSRFANVVS